MCSPSGALVFNDIIHHDVTWGERIVRQAIDLHFSHFPHILSLGLSQLHEIITAESPEGLWEKLYSEFPPGLHKPNLLFNYLKERDYPLYTP